MQRIVGLIAAKRIRDLHKHFAAWVIKWNFQAVGDLHFALIIIPRVGHIALVITKEGLIFGFGTGKNIVAGFILYVGEVNKVIGHFLQHARTRHPIFW
ncbi:Uncharacterised protein [Vibrio cholerae]|nr:Uncharacterised protein [Vibrio cholerae]CSC06395.1 Uncharacterised protein [Vibrio cholerae]CSD13280.1 Uncharacterised protein [Vibrio cholerae]